MNSTPNAIASALESSRVLVCVGAGGVGKTTVSATLALRAALSGKSALVCTIDPAKRLANSLGLSQLGNAEARIGQVELSAAGLPENTPLFAMMLDMKQTWDALIERYAPPDKRDKILGSRFYRSLSTALAGSQEYIAMEKLWELRSQRDYGLVVLDTPPTAHALDFLDAPNRVLDFLDNEAARWLLSPALAAGKVGLKLMNLGGSYVAKTLARFTGAETLQELASFMSAMSGLNTAFRERAQQVRGLLSERTTRFVLVTAPMKERIDEVAHFHQLLKQNQMQIAAVVVNRVHPAVTEAQRHADQRLTGPVAEKVHATIDEASMLAAQDAEGIAEIARRCPGTPLVLVPRFELDVHDLSGLSRTARFLVGEEAVETARPLAG